MTTAVSTDHAELTIIRQALLNTKPTTFVSRIIKKPVRRCHCTPKFRRFSEFSWKPIASCRVGLASQFDYPTAPSGLSVRCTFGTVVGPLLARGAVVVLGRGRPFREAWP